MVLNPRWTDEHSREMEEQESDSKKSDNPLEIRKADTLVYSKKKSEADMSTLDGAQNKHSR